MIKHVIYYKIKSKNRNLGKEILLYKVQSYATNFILAPVFSEIRFVMHLKHF